MMRHTPLHCWAAAAALGAACMAASAHADAFHATPAANTKSKTAAADSWTTARQKHNASGLELRYRAPATVKPGAGAALALSISGVTAEGAQVELKGSDPAMRILLGGRPVSGPVALAAGESRRLDLEVLDAPEGLQQVAVYLTQNGRTSVVSVPVKVGQGQQLQKAQGEAHTTPSGEKVISLPAQTK
jgi:hypothetical protein